MKICLISPQYPGYGGYGVYLAYLVNGLRTLGHEVHTLTGPPTANQTQASDAESHTVPTGGYEGFRFVNFELKVNRALKRLQTEERFDLIQYNLPSYFGLPLFHPPELPLLITAHGCVGGMIRDFLRYKPRALDLGDLVYIGGGPLFPRMEQWAFRKADRIIAVSQWVKRILLQLYGLPSEKVTVIHNGIDTEHFKPFNNAQTEIAHLLDHDNSERPIVLYMARIMGAKDTATFVQAMPKVLESNPDTLFLFRGDTVALHNYLRSLLNRTTSPNSYKFLGFVGNADLPSLYSAASVYVLPSIHEPFPYTLLEALACGTPAVASAVGGIPEIIKNGENGLLVSPKNPNTLAKSIAGLLDDRQTAQRLGRRGRETVEANFNLKLFLERFDHEIRMAAG